MSLDRSLVSVVLRAAETSAPLRDDRGSVFVEYVVVLVAVTLLAALGVLACGLPLLELFRAQVSWLGLPIP